MDYISMRDLRRLSGASPIKPGDRTVALLIPFKRPDMKRLRATLKRARELAETRGRASDDAALVAMGIDPTDYSEETVRAIQNEWRGAR